MVMVTHAACYYKVTLHPLYTLYVHRLPRGGWNFLRDVARVKARATPEFQWHSGLNGIARTRKHSQVFIQSYVLRLALTLNDSQMHTTHCHSLSILGILQTLNYSDGVILTLSPTQGCSPILSILGILQTLSYSEHSHAQSHSGLQPHSQHSRHSTDSQLF